MVERADSTNDRGHGPLLQGRKEPGNKVLRKGRVSLPNQVYFTTSTTLDRQRFFKDFDTGCAAARCFEDDAILDDAKMLAWVLMPDHGHWLVQLGEKHTLAGIMNRIKSASARMANRVLKRQGQVWQRTFYDHAVRADEDLRKLAGYIVANPLRSGIARHICDYPFWNAIWI